MKFISICSGIEAASVAFAPLGWRAIAFSEIEPFPCAVLAHHYPDVPNFGDMTKFRDWPEEIFIEADAIVGGPPCQAFSVAGLRAGLSDDRGNLTLTYAELINHADAIRTSAGKQPVILLYENVPGLLSDKTGAFGSLLGALAGEDGELQPPGKKWTNAGCVSGPERALAWAVTDAQFFGVAQRRRRVFLIGSARDGFNPAAILFEPDRLRRDIAPSREARQVAPTIPARSTAGGGLGTDFDCDGGVIQVCPTLRAGGNRTGGDRPQGTDVDTADSLIPVAYGGNNQSGPIDVATARNACASASGRMDFETETFLVAPVATAIRTANTSANGHGISDELAHTLDGAQGQCVAFDTTQITSATNRCNPQPGDPCHHLAAGAHAPAIAFPANLSGTQCASTENLAPSMGAKNPTAVAVALRGREGGATAELGDDVQNCLRASSGVGDKPHILTAMRVRRLTPRECERLQGFPDDYTLIPWKAHQAWAKKKGTHADGKSFEDWLIETTGRGLRQPTTQDCPDGPRYKALGNSWAVPNVAWIGRRIQDHINGSL